MTAVDGVSFVGLVAQLVISRNSAVHGPFAVARQADDVCSVDVSGRVESLASLFVHDDRKVAIGEYVFVGRIQQRRGFIFYGRAELWEVQRAAEEIFVVAVTIGEVRTYLVGPRLLGLVEFEIDVFL